MTIRSPEARAAWKEHGQSDVFLSVREVRRVCANLLPGAQVIFVPFCTDERYAYLRVRYCAQARCIENHVYTAIAGSVGNLPNVESLGIHYAQSGIFTPAEVVTLRDVARTVISK